MTEKIKKHKFHFGLAPRLITGVILIALIISSLSVYIGAKTYWDDITYHYDSLAKNIADTVQNVFKADELARWGETALKFRSALRELPAEEGQTDDQTESYIMDADKVVENSIAYVNRAKVDESLKKEVISVLQEPRYYELISLIFNLRENMALNDIYLCALDTEELEMCDKEGKETSTWAPFAYIMDTYADSSWWFPIGNRAEITSTPDDMLKNNYFEGIQPDFGEPMISYYTDTYILTGMSYVVSDGKTLAAIGVEIPMPTLEDDMNNYIWKMIWVDLAALGAVLIIVIFLIVFLVTRPIKKVAKEAERFVSDNAEVSEILGKIRTHDEIQALSESLLSLEYGVRDYIDNIKTMTAEKEHISAELNVAKKIQTEMLPTEFPESDRFDLYASMTPAKSVGGDFYDFFMLDDNRLALVMADVSGKGIPAALFMSITKTILKNCAEGAHTPSKALEATNNIICDVNKSGYFVTAWLGILDLKTGDLIYANAGHEYPAVKCGGQYELIVSENCPPLGTMEDMEYFDERLTLLKGDSIFLYTDGVPEAKNADGLRFGLDRMLRVLNLNADLSSEDLLKAMKKDIDEFAGDIDPFDDVTMMNVHM